MESLDAETMELADLDVFDLARSRRIEQEVLDLLDDLSPEENLEPADAATVEAR